MVENMPDPQTTDWTAEDKAEWEGRTGMSAERAVVGK